MKGPRTYHGWYDAPPQRLDIRTWTGQLTPELQAWLGDIPYHQDGDDLLLNTGDLEPARVRPGWMLLRHPTGPVTGSSPAALDARTLQPAMRTLCPAPLCGKDITGQITDDDGRTYCSKECAAADLRADRGGSRT